MSDYVGQQFGSYRLTRMLGQGGFSDVYLGEHVYLKTEAAVKILQTRLVGSSLDDFLTEARTIARLEHPNIVRVLDFGVKDTVPFLIMAFAANGTLRQRYPRGSIVPLATIVTYTKQISSALQYAHSLKIIHRDIKPENILLGRNDQVFLSDFGIAIIAQSTLQQDAQGVVGTVAYMAPEQIQGRPRPASDQYSLAVIVYECLSGYRPFKGGFTELAAQHMFAPPPPLHEKMPGIHPAIEQVVQKALNKESQQRYPNVEAFSDAFEEAVRIASNRATPTGSTQLSSPLYKPYDPAAISAVTPSSFSSPMPSAQSSSREAAIPQSRLSDEQNIKTVISTPHSTPASPAPPISPTVPAFIPTPSQPPPPPKKGVSRRAMLLGLGGALGVVAVAGGVTWFELASHQKAGSGPSGSTPTPAAPVSHIGEKVSIFQGHANWVASVSWSPDSTLVASGSQDNTILISRASNGMQVYNPYHHTGVVSAVAWSPDGKNVASGSSDKTVLVWNPVSGQLLKYPGVLLDTYGVAWSLPDGKRLAIGGDDNLVHVWDITQNKEVLTLTGHTSTVQAVAWSPNGSFIASGSSDGTVRIWDATSGNRLYIYGGHKGDNVHSVAWSPDGTYIASAGGNDGKVQVWNAMSGNATPVFTYIGHKQLVWAVTWSQPDGKRIASASQDMTVQVWDSFTGNNPYTYHDHQNYVHAVAWSPNGKYIASAGGDYDKGASPGDTSVRVWLAS